MLCLVVEADILLSIAMYCWVLRELAQLRDPPQMGQERHFVAERARLDEAGVGVEDQAHNLAGWYRTPTRMRRIDVKEAAHDHEIHSFIACWRRARSRFDHAHGDRQRARSHLDALGMRILRVAGLGERDMEHLLVRQHWTGL